MGAQGWRGGGRTGVVAGSMAACAEEHCCYGRLYGWEARYRRGLGCEGWIEDDFLQDG